jgi:hypothetical protein
MQRSHTPLAIQVPPGAPRPETTLALQRHLALKGAYSGLGNTGSLE